MRPECRRIFDACIQTPDTRPLQPYSPSTSIRNTLYCWIFRRSHVEGSGHERRGLYGMYPYSREINGAFRPSPSAIGHQRRAGLLTRTEPVDDHDRSVQSVNGEMLARGTPLLMDAAIDRVPRQSRYTAVEVDVWARTVGPATNDATTGPSV